MKFLTKTVLACFVFSLFVLATLHANALINKFINPNVLGVTAINTSLCGSLGAIYRQYCTGSTLPTNIGSTFLFQNNYSDRAVQIYNVLTTPSSDGRYATITWRTNTSVQSVVQYGTSPAALLLSVPETEPATNHSVTLSTLRAGQNYYFRIKVGEEVFDNSGIPYSFKTSGVKN